MAEILIYDVPEQFRRQAAEPNCVCEHLCSAVASDAELQGIKSFSKEERYLTVLDISSDDPAFTTALCIDCQKLYAAGELLSIRRIFNGLQFPEKYGDYNARREIGNA